MNPLDEDKSRLAAELHSVPHSRIKGTAWGGEGRAGKPNFLFVASPLGKEMRFCKHELFRKLCLGPSLRKQFATTISQVLNRLGNVLGAVPLSCGGQTSDSL